MRQPIAPAVEQTAEGAPRVRIEARDPLPALALLAKIRGLTSEQPPPPPPSNVTLNLVMESLPTETLCQLAAALREAEAKQRAIPAEATQAAGVGDGLHPPFRG